MDVVYQCGTHQKGDKSEKPQRTIDQHTLNIYFGFDDVEPTEYLEKYALGEVARPWLLEIFAAPGPPPPWITTGVPIQRNNLNFEAKGCQTFVYSRLDPCQNQTYLPISRAVLVASIMDG